MPGDKFGCCKNGVFILSGTTLYTRCYFNICYDSHEIIKGMHFTVNHDVFDFICRDDDFVIFSNEIMSNINEKKWQNNILRFNKLLNIYYEYNNNFCVKKIKCSEYYVKDNILYFTDTDLYKLKDINSAPEKV